MPTFRPGALICLAGVFATPYLLVQPVRAFQPSEPDPLKRTYKALKDNIYKALKDDPALRGAWVTATLDPDKGKLLLEISVDDTPSAARQYSALVGLIDKTLPGGSYDISPRMQRYPVSHLLKLVQDLIDDDPSIRGCQIQGAYFKAPKDEDDYKTRVLVLFGRMLRSESANTKERQLNIKQKIKRLCDDYIDKQPAWRELRTKKLIVVAEDEQRWEQVLPSDRVAAVRYQEGREFWMKGRYAEASQAFRAALAEDPNNHVYLYWRAVAEIERGNSEKAYRLIRPVILHRRSSWLTPDRRVPEALERVQGRVRTILNQLELRAALEPEETGQKSPGEGKLPP